MDGKNKCELTLRSMIGCSFPFDYGHVTVRVKVWLQEAGPVLEI
jgi:hypothetical protein